MKKLSLSIVITAFVLLLGIAGASAAELPGTSGSSIMIAPGPYEGVFSGYVSSNNGSQAPITLELTHRGENVDGIITYGKGLYVNAGLCGGANIPSGEKAFSVKTQPDDPKKLSTQLSFDVSSYQVGVNLESLISEDGKEITSQVNIDLPWICGPDPILTGILYRTK